MRKWKNPAKDLSPLKAHRSRGIRNGGSKKKNLSSVTKLSVARSPYLGGAFMTVVYLVETLVGE